MTETTHQPVTETDEDRALKAKHRTMWALGDYPAVATEIIPALGPVLVEASGIGPGSRVLDVAAGIRQRRHPRRQGRRAGDRVATSPPSCSRRASARPPQPASRWSGARLTPRRCPFAENTFDAVLSCVGVMFAPHHQASADELVRVCRSGGTIGLISWTPEGFIGQLFATMKPYVAPPPPGAQPPPLWGKEEHVSELLGDRVHRRQGREAACSASRRSAAGLASSRPVRTSGELRFAPAEQAHSHQAPVQHGRHAAEHGGHDRAGELALVPGVVARQRGRGRRGRPPRPRPGRRG